MYVHYILVKLLNCMSYTLGRAGLEECLQHDLCRPIKQLLFVTNKVCICIYSYIVMSYLLHNTYTYVHKLNVVYIRICDRACGNRPSEHKKSPILLCFLYHNLITIYTTATKSSSLLQNLMAFLLQLTEMG